MSEQHTPGPLVAKKNGTITGGKFYTYTNGASQSQVAMACVMDDDNGDQESNTRRIVACWNACQGLSTEMLESITTVGDTLLDRFAQREKTERELEAQRDQLLAAVVAVRHWDVSNLALDIPVEIRIQMQAAIEACEPTKDVQHLPSDDTEGGAA